MSRRDETRREKDTKRKTYRQLWSDGDRTPAFQRTQAQITEKESELERTNERRTKRNEGGEGRSETKTNRCDPFLATAFRPSPIEAPNLGFASLVGTEDLSCELAGRDRGVHPAHLFSERRKTRAGSQLLTRRRAERRV